MAGSGSSTVIGGQLNSQLGGSMYLTVGQLHACLGCKQELESAIPPLFAIHVASSLISAFPPPSLCTVEGDIWLRNCMCGVSCEQDTLPE